VATACIDASEKSRLVGWFMWFADVHDLREKDGNEEDKGYDASQSYPSSPDIPARAVAIVKLEVGGGTIIKSVL
jgi:hypothetical protein